MESSENNLNNQEAVQKLKEIAEKVDVCMFCTNLEERPIASSPMSTQEVDEKGNIWFLSADNSYRNDNIRDNNEVQLFYSLPTDYTFMSVYGKAYIYQDRETIDEYWEPIAKAWFTDGKYDPNVSVIRVEPKDIYYWDTKSNKIVSFFKFAVSAITGTPSDNGIEGKLDV